jgi:hypothetical protein
VVLQEESPTFSRARRKLSKSLQTIAMLMLAGEAMIIGLGCGSLNVGDLSRSVHSSARIQLEVSPSFVALAPQTRVLFTATVRGTSNSAVTWSASEGTILSDGTFISPSTSSRVPIAIMATSVADPRRRAVTVSYDFISRPSIAEQSLRFQPVREWRDTALLLDDLIRIFAPWPPFVGGRRRILRLAEPIRKVFVHREDNRCCIELRDTDVHFDGVSLSE